MTWTELAYRTASKMRVNNFDYGSKDGICGNIHSLQNIYFFDPKYRYNDHSRKFSERF